GFGAFARGLAAGGRAVDDARAARGTRVRVVVPRAQAHGTHAGSAGAGDVAAAQVTDVHRTLWGDAEAVERAPNRLGARVGNARPVGENGDLEMLEKPDAVDQLSHDPPRREARVADQRASHAASRERLERVPGPVERQHLTLEDLVLERRDEGELPH